ncbi:MAG: hypothetical protein J6B02_03615 [Selenomonadales bacterium]|nr:hypothetical protein [Selenomonadales bacterium]
MKQFTYNKLLVALIAIGFIASLIIGYQRYQVEYHNTVVDLAADYDDVVKLAAIEGRDKDEIFRQLKEAGVSSVAVYETTLARLHERGTISAVPGSQLEADAKCGRLTSAAWQSFVESKDFHVGSIYIVSDYPTTLDEVTEDMQRRLGSDRVSTHRIDGQRVLAVKADFEKAQKWNLGLSTDQIKEVTDHGFWVIARPSNYLKVTEDDVKSVFDRLSVSDRVSAIVFSGPEILGHPDHLAVTVELMKDKNMTLGLIEHVTQLQFYPQKGLKEVMQAMDYHGARVYSIPKDEQAKMKLNDAVQRWTLTDEERNIRINFLRMFEKPAEGMDLIETNLAYVREVKADLEERGFAVGRASVMDPYYASSILLALITIGAVASGVLYLSLVRPFAAKYQYALLIILSAILCYPILSGAGTLVRQVVALASACIIPAVVMTWQLDSWRKSARDKSRSWGRITIGAACRLAVLVFASLVGGFYVAGILSDVRFFLEAEIFRGVKLTFLMPLILISITYLVRFSLFEVRASESPSFASQIQTVLNYPVTVKALALIGAMALAALIFIGRSGHTAGVPVPGIELKMRAFLEQVMYARPRSKEFLIGHPAFFLAAIAYYRNLPNFLLYLLVVAATIGQGSLVETFAHMRTPVFMSFIRALDGLAAGIGVGLIAVIGVWIVRKVWYRVQKELNAHE